MIRGSRTALVAVAAATLVAACGGGGGGAAGPSASPTAAGGTGVRLRQLTFAGTTRNYRVFSPGAAINGAAQALVVVLGGVGDSAQSMTNATQFDREAATGNFVVAYAEPAGPSWSAGFCCAGPDSNAVDDVGFLDQLLNQLQRDYHIDQNRVYAVGVSAGAMMAYRWACADAGRIAGVGSVAGTMILDGCHPAAALSIIEVHGTADPLVPYDGGTLSPPGVGTQPVPSSIAVARQWATLDSCASAPTVETQGTVTTTTWSGCATGTGVRLMALDGAGHTWYTPDFGAVDGAVDATHQIWSFLSSHNRAG